MIFLKSKCICALLLRSRFPSIHSLYLYLFLYAYTYERGLCIIKMMMETIKRSFQNSIALCAFKWCVYTINTSARKKRKSKIQYKTTSMKCELPNEYIYTYIYILAGLLSIRLSNVREQHHKTVRRMAWNTILDAINWQPENIGTETESVYGN